VELRFKADIRTLGFMAWYFSLFGGLWVAWEVLPWAARVPLVAMLMSVSWFCAVITHNVIHSPLWKSRALNKLTQIALSLCYGFAVSDYIPGHNLSHHRYVQDRRDVMRTSKLRFRWNLLNLIFFFPIIGLDVVKANGAYARFARTKNPKWSRQRTLEVVVVWAVKLAFLALDWKKAAMLVFLPHLWAVCGITVTNLLQHDGTDADHPYNHSRNFVGKVFNWFTFNNGFHGMHHMEPGLHWSLLPKAHEERLKPHMDPRLDEPSLAAYLFRTYVWPGKRLRFDGAPVVLPEEGPDMDWIEGTVAGNPADEPEPAPAE
jgi:fatty acid desaturase